MSQSNRLGSRKQIITAIEGGQERGGEQAICYLLEAIAGGLLRIADELQDIRMYGVGQGEVMEHE